MKTPEDISRMIAWDMYFSNLVGMSMHPGSGKDYGYGPSEKLSIEDCARVADEMLALHDVRWRD